MEGYHQSASSRNRTLDGELSANSVFNAAIDKTQLLPL